MTHKNPAWLLDYKENVFSQAGEDGVISRVLSLIPDKNNWCVEFGAWDGKYLSNTCNLIVNHGFSAVLIEADKKKFQKLQENFKGQVKVYAVNRYVGFGEKDNLDEILSDKPCPQDFDFLSIDIDGNDYYAWQAVSRYQPKVVIIEFNPTIPTRPDLCSRQSLIVIRVPVCYHWLSWQKRRGTNWFLFCRLMPFLSGKNISRFLKSTTMSPLSSGNRWS